MAEPPWIIEWLDAFSMSNPEIDAEHRRFIKLVNELNTEIMSNRQDKAVVRELMGLILEDTITNFSHEERIFAEHNYPASDEHAQSHAEIISRLKQASKEIQSTSSGRVWIEAGQAIKNLLVDHVLNEDTEFNKYLQTR
ncbi:MAG: bacteriohemerythrin [Mariprofundaceae bacterium]|nr:bacteriohemerythrin [Mariprofundaceae bacterium]